MTSFRFTPVGFYSRFSPAGQGMQTAAPFSDAAVMPILYHLIFSMSRHSVHLARRIHSLSICYLLLCLYVLALSLLCCHKKTLRYFPVLYIFEHCFIPAFHNIPFFLSSNIYSSLLCQPIPQNTLCSLAHLQHHILDIASHVLSLDIMCVPILPDLKKPSEINLFFRFPVHLLFRFTQNPL